MIYVANKMSGANHSQPQAGVCELIPTSATKFSKKILERYESELSFF
jgi:hypothetical protein